MNARTQRPTPRREWLEALDEELVALARGAGALRLGLGAGLALLRRTGGAAELGFPDLGAYSLERLGRRRRWAEDTARVAEQLEALPLIRAALRQGALGWSMAELLARHAIPETEAALLADARGQTVRAMRAALATASDGDDDRREAEDDARTLQITVDRVSDWAYELTRRFLLARRPRRAGRTPAKAGGMHAGEGGRDAHRPRRVGCTPAKAGGTPTVRTRVGCTPAKAGGTPTVRGGRDAHRPKAGGMHGRTRT